MSRFARCSRALLVVSGRVRVLNNIAIFRKRRCACVQFSMRGQLRMYAKKIEIKTKKASDQFLADIADTPRKKMAEANALNLFKDYLFVLHAPSVVASFWAVHHKIAHQFKSAPQQSLGQSAIPYNFVQDLETSFWDQIPPQRSDQLEGFFKQILKMSQHDSLSTFIEDTVKHFETIKPNLVDQVGSHLSQPFLDFLRLKEYLVYFNSINNNILENLARDDFEDLEELPLLFEKKLKLYVEEEPEAVQNIFADAVKTKLKFSVVGAFLNVERDLEMEIDELYEIVRGVLESLSDDYDRKTVRNAETHEEAELFVMRKYLTKVKKGDDSFSQHPLEKKYVTKAIAEAVRFLREEVFRVQVHGAEVYVMVALMVLTFFWLKYGFVQPKEEEEDYNTESV
eukprot:TRINITY_DN3329_c0_g1_i1.p1 TRINITY_DN3329_c0_g1~~TRINITY_DN3329_c0_g1_i1.p1  ORF type:complete len:397 (-),score=66.07 TRINITY_DN3329_c0_g1_i1:151-1341(-)